MSSSIFRLAGTIAASAQAQHAGDDLDGGHPTALKHTPLRQLGKVVISPMPRFICVPLPQAG